MTERLSLEDVLGYVVNAKLAVRDPGLLASAVARPHPSMFGQDAYPTLAEKAAALLHSVAQNQALMDSNKRLALLCAHVLVRLNGHRLGLSKDAAFTLLSEWVASELDDIRAIATVLEIRPEASA